MTDAVCTCEFKGDQLVSLCHAHGAYFQSRMADPVAAFGWEKSRVTNPLVELAQPKSVPGLPPIPTEAQLLRAELLKAALPAAITAWPTLTATERAEQLEQIIHEAMRRIDTGA